MATRIRRIRAKSNVPAQVQLTDYESVQVKQIASWKSRPPNPFTEMFRRITLPGEKVVKKIVPDALVRSTIDQAFKLAEWLVGKKGVLRQAGVENPRELRKEPFKKCNRLAMQTGIFSQIIATAEEAATGAGGILTTLVDIFGFSSYR